MKKINCFFYLAIFLIIFFTQFYHPVNGLADDQIGLVTAERVIQNITPQEGYEYLMEKYLLSRNLHPCSALGLPWINTIYTLVTHGYSSLVGLSIPRWHFLSVLLFVFLLYMAKKLGDFFFGKYGLFFPFLLATNAYVLVVIRNSIILFSLSLALQFGAIYYFLKAHEKFNPKFLALTAVFLFLTLSNGSTYSPVGYLYLVIVFLSLVAWKTIQRFRGSRGKDFILLKKRYYFFLFLLIPLFASVSYFVNDLVLNTPLGSSLDGFLYFTKSKFPPNFPTLESKIVSAILNFKELFRGTPFGEIFGPHATFFPYRIPVLSRVVAFLFFLGIFSFFKKLNYKKFILLAFLGYTLFYLYRANVARVFITFIPFLLLVASSGFVFLLEALKKLKFNRLIVYLFLGIIFTLLAYDVYYFEDYFVVKSNSNLMRGTGVAVIEKYLDTIGKNRVLVFMEGGYPTWYLADFRETDFVVNDITDPEKFREQVSRLEEQYKEVILIFPTHYSYVGNPGVLPAVWEDFNYRYRFFLEAFPEKVMADKVVSDYQGIPQHYLYRFTRDEELPKAKRLVFEDPSQSLPLGISGEIEALRIQGGAEKLKFEGIGEVPVHSNPAIEAVINFGRESFYNFYLNFDQEFFNSNFNQKEVSEIEKKFLLGKSGGLTWIEPDLTPDKPPYLLEFLFDFPYPIEKVEIKTDMRLFNAEGSEAAIRGYLVDEEKHFTDYQKKGKRFLFLEVKSDDSSTYAPGGQTNVLSKPSNWGIGRLSSYKILRLKKPQKVLAALSFESRYYKPDYFLAHLYNLGHSSFFKFTLDTEGLKKLAVKESTVLSLEKDSNETGPVVINIIYR